MRALVTAIGRNRRRAPVVGTRRQPLFGARAVRRPAIQILRALAQRRLDDVLPVRSPDGYVFPAALNVRRVCVPREIQRKQVVVALIDDRDRYARAVR